MRVLAHAFSLTIHSCITHGSLQRPPRRRLTYPYSAGIFQFTAPSVKHRIPQPNSDILRSPGRIELAFIQVIAGNIDIFPGTREFSTRFSWASHAGLRESTRMEFDGGTGNHIRGHGTFLHNGRRVNPRLARVTSHVRQDGQRQADGQISSRRPVLGSPPHLPEHTLSAAPAHLGQPWTAAAPGTSI